VITLNQGQSLSVTPQTLNYLGGTNTYESSGYTATIADIRLLSNFSSTGVNTTSAVNMNSTSTLGTNTSKTVIGTTINLTATTVNILFPTGVNQISTTLTVTGRDSGARVTIPLQINKNI
jgi:hypothetical protein